MSPESTALLRLAESIADGAPIDWEAAETHAGVEDRAVVRQMRVLAGLAELHRSLPADPGQPAPGPRAGATGSTIGSWGHLALLGPLGDGTSGEVYRAWDQALEREVALKLLRPGAWSEDPETSRIAKEGRHLARVRHPNVITVYGVAVHEGRVGLWMELIRGATLEQLLGTRGPFSAREAALVGMDLCRALAAIHAAGLVHRDVKAQNVMREDGGRIVLMDLGTGREIAADQPPAGANVAGTPLYFAPEIFAGAPAGVRTDVYSLGVLLYRLVTGSFPVRGTTMEELREAHATGRGVRLRDVRADLPSAFVGVIDRAIAGDPGRRHGTAGELEADLAQSLQEMAGPVAGVDGRPRRATAWRAAALAASAVALLVVALLWSGLWTRTAPAPDPGAIRSLAVLPLANFSGDPSQEYFADGLTDELIATLGRLDGLRVTSQTSVAQFKGTRQPLQEIARLLNVDAVLEGSVRVMPGARSPDDETRVRINARLILAGTDTQLWNRTFERVLTDVLALQSELADAVAREINLRLTPNQRTALAGQGTTSAEAQKAYLEGRSYLPNVNRDGLMQAREAFERAVRLDPGFARAHASLSVCYVFLQLVGVLPRADGYALAVGAANRALQLDPNLPEAHGALADLQMVYDWNWAAAGASYTRALALNPSYTFARRQYAWYLAALGRGDEALQHAQLAETADPLSADARAAVAMMLYFNRDYDGAIVQMQRALSLPPEGAQLHFGLARAYAAKEAYPDAIRELEQAIRLSGGTPVYVVELARTYAAAGDATRAREILAELEQTAKASQTYVVPSVSAYVYAALGDRDAAFRLLDEAIRERAYFVLLAKVDPRLDPLRDDPRFAGVLGRLGLPEGR